MIRQINFLRHPLTSRQAIWLLFHCWRESTELPITIITWPGQANAAIKMIRVAIAKERARNPSDKRWYYGFKTSTTFPYTDGGIKGEAIVIYWRMTHLQQVKNKAKYIKPLGELFNVH